MAGCSTILKFRHLLELSADDGDHQRDTLAAACCCQAADSRHITCVCPFSPRRLQRARFSGQCAQQGEGKRTARVIQTTAQTGNTEGLAGRGGLGGGLGESSKKYLHKNMSLYYLLAERAGFEPASGYYPEHAFQACDLNRSSTSPWKGANSNGFRRTGEGLRVFGKSGAGAGRTRSGCVWNVWKGRKEKSGERRAKKCFIQIGFDAFPRLCTDRIFMKNNTKMLPGQGNFFVSQRAKF